MGGSVHTIKITEGLVGASKEIRLEVNADETKYMVMSRDQNAGLNHNIKTDVKFLENVEHFKHLRTTLINQNFIRL